MTGVYFRAEKPEIRGYEEGMGSHDQSLLIAIRSDPSSSLHLSEGRAAQKWEASSLPYILLSWRET